MQKNSKPRIIKKKTERGGNTDKKLYARGMHGQRFYNAVDTLGLILLHRRPPAGVKYTAREYYGKEKYQYVNTFAPENNRKKPIFIYIHGGGWISGITDMRNAYVAKWAEQGFYCASVSYTYAPQKIFPEQIREIFTAIDFILDKADDENLDTDNIVMAGESAGAYYIAYAATCCCFPELYDILDIEFRHRDTFKLTALLSLCGCFNIDHLANDKKPQSKFIDMKTMVQTYSGMRIEDLRKWVKTKEGEIISPHANEAYPPVCFIWAQRDYLKHETFDFMLHLREHNVPCTAIKAKNEIALHAWVLAYFLPQGRICLNKAKDYILPLMPQYFKKENEKWKFI